MGVVPDTSALVVRKKASSQRKRVRPPTDCSNAVSLRLAEDETDAVDLLRLSAIEERRKRAADERARKRLRQKDLKALEDLQELSGGEELPEIVDTDPALVEEFKRNALQESRRGRLGGAVQQELLSAKEKGDEKAAPVPRQATQQKPASAASPESGSKESSSVVYRDEDGFVITQARWLELQREKRGGYKVKKGVEGGRPERDKGPLRNSEQPPVAWGGGVVQEQLLKQREEEERTLAQQPLTRTEIDSEYDKMLQEQFRWEDPMREFIQEEERAKESTDTTTDNNTDNKDVKKQPKCRFTAPPNRYGILAGYRWDGVVRGNGYEAKWLRAANKEKSRKEETYRWSIEDM